MLKKSNLKKDNDSKYASVIDQAQEDKRIEFNQTQEDQEKIQNKTTVVTNNQKQHARILSFDNDKDRSTLRDKLLKN